MSNSRIIFTEGGKGGVAKTEVALCLVSWYRHHGFDPVLLDFDVENTNKSGLQNFYPEARKLDIHKHGALDELFDACEQANGIVLADLGAGASAATAGWFEEAFDDAAELAIEFTAIGVVTNDAGAVQSALNWGTLLQDRVDYLIVLNEMSEKGSKFEYWHEEPAVEQFMGAFDPAIMKMGARVAEFQAELRNQAVTLDDVINGNVSTDFLRMLKNVQRAKRYRRAMFAGFDQASAILLPSNG